MNALEITGLEQLFFGLFLIMHGLVHLMFMIYNYDKESNVYLGWSGRSWLLDKVIPPNITVYIGKFIWILIMILFVGSGLSVLDLLVINDYLVPLIIISSAIATLGFIVFYDGLSPTPFNWILGVVINFVLIAYVIFFPNNVLLLLAILLVITLYGILLHSKIVSKITTPQS
ncbi:MAG: hypothetical protein ACXAC8_18275 [Candidatus Hodarchaeales archaeon]|jgi:hypothetical protein